MATTTSLAGRQRSRREAQGVESLQGVVEPVRSRRSWRYTAGAAAAILAGGLLSAALYSQGQRTETLFTLARTVQRGETITARDLTTITVTPGQRIDGYAPAQAASLIGRVAAITLPAGSLVTRSAIARQLPIGEGRAVVGVAVKASQMPATGLSAGDRVVITPIAGQEGTVESTRAAPVDVAATVAAAPTTDPVTGLVVVDVTVPVAEASDVAGRAAAGQVAVYLIGGTGRSS